MFCLFFAFKFNVMNILQPLLVTCLMLCFLNTTAQDTTVIRILETGQSISMRGLSLPDPKTVWVSGNNGTIGLSNDSGMTYIFKHVNNHNKLDFRDIHAFNDTEALIINAGSPGYILKTLDGGNNWKEVYVNREKNIFFNGFDFWDNQHGIAFSDPVKNKLFIVTTHDGGETWQEPDSIDMPECYEEEAGFAASGSSIHCGRAGKVIIGTGGSHARLFRSDDFGTHWNVLETPMKSGTASSGIFSVVLTDENRIYISGGDYKADSLGGMNFFFTDDGGLEWNQPESSPAGFSSCLIQSSGNSMVSTGTRGTDLSFDAGATWFKADSHPFYVTATCDSCSYIMFAGPNGRLGRMERK